MLAGLAAAGAALSFVRMHDGARLAWARCCEAAAGEH